MKCQSCGARVKNNEEMCPECGKYIVRESNQEYSAPPAEEVDIEQLEAAEAEVMKPTAPTSAEYHYKDHLLLPTLLKGGMGLAIIIFMIYYMCTSMRFRLLPSSRITAVLAILFGGFSIFSAVASFIQQKNCYLDISDSKVSGVIPVGMFDTEHFEIDIADIVCVEKTDFHSKNSSPKVILISAQRRIEIKGASSSMLSDFCKSVQNKIEEKGVTK